MRLMQTSDAAELAAAYSRNRAHLAYWDPARPEEFYTEEWQVADIARRLVAHEAGADHLFGLFAGEKIIGRFNLTSIVRGPFQSSSLGYWVDASYTGRGLASAAVNIIIETARDDLGLHRIEASTLVDNDASQGVLRKAGFMQIGMAPKYLKIADTWQDHNLYQILLHN